MNHDHQPAAGHLTFPGGGVVTGAAPAASEATPPAFTSGSPVHPVLQPAPHQLGTAPAASTRSGTPGGSVHTMPSGATITFADPESLTRGDRNTLTRAMREMHAAGNPESQQIGGAMLLAKLIVAWSYPWPLPSVDLDSLDRLPIRDAQAAEKFMKAADDVLWPPTKPSPDQHADPNSPTEPSGA